MYISLIRFDRDITKKLILFRRDKRSFQYTFFYVQFTVVGPLRWPFLRVLCGDTL